MNKVNMRQGLEFEMKTFPSEGIRQEYRNVGSMNCNFFGYIH